MFSILHFCHICSKFDIYQNFITIIFINAFLTDKITHCSKNVQLQQRHSIVAGNSGINIQSGDFKSALYCCESVRVRRITAKHKSENLCTTDSTDSNTRWSGVTLRTQTCVPNYGKRKGYPICNYSLGCACNGTRWLDPSYMRVYPKVSGLSR
jgi:hypothetical protein